MSSDTVDRVLIIVIMVLALIAMVSLLLKLTGHSPTDITILYSLVTMLIVSAFKLHYDQGQFHEFSRNAKISFEHSREDSRQIKTDLQELKIMMMRKKR